MGEWTSIFENKKRGEIKFHPTFISNFFFCFCMKPSPFFSQNSPKPPSFHQILHFAHTTPSHSSKYNIFIYFLFFAFPLCCFLFKEWQDIFVCEWVDQILNLRLFWMILGLLFAFYMFACLHIILLLYMFFHAHTNCLIKCHNSQFMCYF